MKKGFTSIDEYIAACPEQSQSYMQKYTRRLRLLRQILKKKLVIKLHVLN